VRWLRSDRRAPRRFDDTTPIGPPLS